MGFSPVDCMENSRVDVKCLWDCVQERMRNPSAGHRCCPITTAAGHYADHQSTPPPHLGCHQCSGRTVPRSSPRQKEFRRPPLANSNSSIGEISDKADSTIPFGISPEEQQGSLQHSKDSLLESVKYI